MVAVGLSCILAATNDDEIGACDDGSDEADHFNAWPQGYVNHLPDMQVAILEFYASRSMLVPHPNVRQTGCGRNVG